MLVQGPIRSQNQIWMFTFEKLKLETNEYSTGKDNPYYNGDAYNVEFRYDKNGTLTIYTPKDPSDCLLWMKITVKNIAKEEKEFDFSRIRLISDNRIGKPDFIYSEAPIYKEGFFHKIKPGEDFTRWLVYLFPVNTTPYRLAYDYIINNRLVDKLAFDIK
ncbi:MAG: DUF4352 domain-containing protein [Spirochaetes bacterium]|nr:DUF4352 domain-containing protein [Spirochaetota bacterium]